ncbi:MAG: hypothetical protein A2621_04515 [Alphaproteobacteria bacterium RIFCSPHIGHO2_01_FULL_41_14]|nr:MAG: hypothetical protein A2065_04700 [Alphaproteobacteria bacterium GWB1_45_5]OFW76115.1 MAG: hypothetical protein A3K20_03230 [Alphaproteobacteria bacterium GWA1_45_9]OFW90224.1 MAG: hypothetical protein A2621_04515 [Alphaproteobacteria bacterium RIFCSPHIGHO2_01_FULL_41_14]HLB59643.1 phosphotransferase [Bdellovibrionota bacterium]
MRLSSALSYSLFLSRVGEFLRPFIEIGLKSLVQEDAKNLSFFEILDGMSITKLYRFTHKNQSYVLRILAPHYTAEKRRNEIEAHTLGAQLGIAPRLYYTDPNAFILIMAYVESRVLTLHDLKKKDILETLGKILSKLHGKSDFFPHRRSQRDRVMLHVQKARRYDIAFPSVYEDLYERYQAEANQQEKKDQALVHGDLNLSNILLTSEGKIFLIDWATASLDNQYVDLGNLTLWGGMGPVETESLMDAYFGRPPTKKELTALCWGQKGGAFYTATLWLQAAYGDVGRHPSLTMAEQRQDLDRWMEEPLREAWDYTRTGDVVSLKAGERSLEDKLKYGLSFLKAYQNWVC